MHHRQSAYERSFHQRVALLFLAGIAATAQSGLAEEPTLSPERLMTHVQYLASEELGGRQAGTNDEREAAEYIAAKLERFAVAPLPGFGRYQEFDLPARRSKPTRRSVNVLGWIEGADLQLRDDIVVIGAHLDHVGTHNGQVHPGANDNASGVAAVLEVAAALQLRRDRLARSVLVAFFGSEEIGLVGSERFVKDCPVDLKRIVAMVNIDMVGRPLMDQDAFDPLKKLVGLDDANSIGVVGASQRPYFAKVVEAACEESQLQVFGTRNIPFLSTMIENHARNRSDNASFEREGIPSLFFSTGESDDYHSPRDTVDKIDARLMTRRAAVIHDTVLAIATAAHEDLPMKPRAKPPPEPHEESEQAQEPASVD